MKSCKNNQRFTTAEAASKAALRTKGAIDRYLNITNLQKFRELNTTWSNYAKETYGIEGRLFTEDNNKAVPNKVAFKNIDRKKGINYQKTETEGSVASPRVLAILKDFISRIGVDIKSVPEIVVNGVKQDANGVAQLMQQLIQVVDGKDATALPEEAMHFAVAIIKQTNKPLYKKLMSEINGYQTLNTVFATYGSDPNYQTADGKRDVIKLKEEAIAKVLAETIINRMENSTEKPELLQKTYTWWENILNFLKELFVKSGFDKAAMDIISGKEIGTADQIREEQDSLFLQRNIQAEISDKIDEVSQRITKKENEPNDEDNGYWINGKKIPKRVTDLVKDWYSRKFKNNDLVKSEYEKAVDDLKAEKGTKGHAVLEYAFHLLVDDKGFLREFPLPDSDFESKNFGISREMYEILRDNLYERLQSFPKGTQFKSEITVYDSKRNIAGTIDLLAIEPSGKIHVLDWKFMNLNTLKYNDVPWYKINAWKTQMDEYVRILQDAYDIQPNMFGQTRMIPILTVYTKGNPSINLLPELNEIQIGAVNPKDIVDDYLLPVGTDREKTGNKRIDNLIKKLNAEYQRLSEKQVTPEEKKNKADQLNSLFKGIRHLQMKNDLSALLYQAKLLNLEIQRTIDKYKENWEGKDPALFTEVQRNEMSRELDDQIAAISIYTDLYNSLKSIFGEDVSKEDKKLKKDLRKTAERAKDYQDELNDILNDFTAEHIAKSEGIDHFLNPEKIVKGITKWFGTTATIQLRSLAILYKKANRAFGLSSMETLNENKRLLGLKENFDNWAKGKGLSIHNYFDIIKKKNKNELIDEFNSEFYKLLRTKTAEKDYVWITANIDQVAYKEFLDAKLKEELNRILDKPGIYNQDEIDQINDAKVNGVSNLSRIPYQIRSEIEKAMKLYDISTPESPGWLLYEYTRRFPKESWISEEWRELLKPENKPAKDFYDYIREKNQEFQELGYIARGESRVFLPFIRKGFIEKLITKGDKNFGENFFRSISIDESDTGYGQIDPISGRPIDVVPKYFINEIKGEVSTDLFKTMSLYVEAATKYKYVKQIEYQVRAMIAVERNKKAIMTSMFGKTQYEDDGVTLKYTPDNAANTKLIEDMMKAIVYDQRYINSESFDQLLGKIGGWGKTLNKKLGKNIFPEDLEGRQISVNKIVTLLNNTFQLNTLGLNLLSSSSNFFGGNAQSIINAGIYFTKTDYLAAEGTIFINKFNQTDKKKMLGALEYFLPLTDNYNRELNKRLSISTMTAESLQDGLMYFMRQSDWNVQTANFYAYLANTVVIDGKVLNARVYLRQQDKYQDHYAGSPEQRKEIDAEFEKDVKSLIEEKGILKVAEIVDGKFTIPGVDQMSESVVELRRKVQQINKDALGNLTQDDLRTINMQVYGKSFMVFKNWIPRLVDVRLGQMKYNSALDAWEWGRTRTVFKVIGEDLIHSLGNLHDSLVANEKGVEFLKELFEKKKTQYKQNTGKELTMTEDEFMDLVRRNIRNQMIDVIFLLTMFILVAGLQAYKPDDDEDPALKSQYAFIVRAADKFKSELTYFYDPTSIIGLVGKGIFPSVALLENFTKGLKNFLIENWAISTGNEELEKSNKVIKYWMKVFPFTNQMVGYLPMFYPDLAKDLGVKIQSNYLIN